MNLNMHDKTNSIGTVDYPFSNVQDELKRQFTPYKTVEGRETTSKTFHNGMYSKVQSHLKEKSENFSKKISRREKS